MQTKGITIKQMDEKGKGLAQLAQLSAVDHDGDSYLPGAFSWKAGGSQWAYMLPAHDRRAMPFGKSRVYEEGDFAFAELNLNMDTQAGRDWHAVLDFDLKTGEPVQEYSYGFDVLDADHVQRATGKGRVLKRLDVHEISTVIRGAGIGTRTLGIKGAALKEVRYAPLIADLGELSSAVGDDPSILSASGRKQLADIHAAIGAVLEAKGACTGCQGEFDPKNLIEGQCAGCLQSDAGKARPEDLALAQFTRHQVRHHLAG